MLIVKSTDDLSMPSKRKRQLATLAATKKAESAKKRKVAGEAQVVVDETFSTPSAKPPGRPKGTGDSSKRNRRTVSKITEEEGELFRQEGSRKRVKVIHFTPTPTESNTWSKRRVRDSRRSHLDKQREENRELRKQIMSKLKNIEIGDGKVIEGFRAAIAQNQVTVEEQVNVALEALNEADNQAAELDSMRLKYDASQTKLALYQRKEHDENFAAVTTRYSHNF